MIPREEFKAILKTLREEFPGAFPKKEFRVFKKGIDLDILKSGVLKIGRTKLRMFLKIYTNHPLYMETHAAGSSRYDLQGKVVGPVTEQEYLNMKKLYEQRLKQKRFLKAQQQKQQMLKPEDKKQEG
jgi:sRNA-binding protein